MSASKDVHKSKGKSFFLVFAAVVLAAAAFFVLHKAFPAPGAEQAAATPTQAPTPTPTAFVPREVTLSAVGDIMVHQRQLNDAKQRDGSYDFSNYFTEVEPYLSGADLTLANLETTLPGKGYTGYPLFGAPDSILDAVQSAGFDVIGTANNHSFDRRWDGIVRTIDTVRAYGFYQTGTYKSAEEYNTPLVIDANGVKVGVIAYAKSGKGGKAVSGEQLSFCIRCYDKADYAKDVQQLRDAGADIVAVIVHWGNEYQRNPSSAIQAEAMEMFQAGVDVIFGSHPHVVEPVEILEVERNDGSQARCAVAYSLGNFVSNQRDRYTDCGIILTVRFEEDAPGHFTIADMQYVPTYVNRAPGYTDYRVLPIIAYIGDEQRMQSLDSYNRDRLTRAWNDLTTHLEEGPAVLVSVP